MAANTVTVSMTRFRREMRKYMRLFEHDRLRAVIIPFRGKPRFVALSIPEYERLSGVQGGGRVMVVPKNVAPRSSGPRQGPGVHLVAKHPAA